MEGGKSKLESWSATLGAGGRGVMRAAGGLTLRRGETSVNPTSSKMVTISVVGLSGGEKDKGSMGVGKSCLCNRFVAPLADDYHIDHISVLSQSDFSGRVVNNDHFLYWGEMYKTSEDGVDFNIQVIEQTEFIDDASFQPFKASGKQEPYVRRCANTRLMSAEKLMYICKNQLGLEQEFTLQLLPDGRSNIDGFICVFDVSLVPNRTLERQVEMTAQILNSLLKTKKPIVLATTKNDEGNDTFVREAERLINRKEFRGIIPMVETSSHENINVDNAFFLVSSMVDRTRGRVRVQSYNEAGRARRDILEMAQEQFARLVRTEVTDYGASWTVVAKKLSPCVEFHTFVDIFGVDAAQRIFRRHVKKLKDTYLSEKVARYLDLLPEVLHELFPTISSLGEDVSHLFDWKPATCTLCRKLENSQNKPWDWMLIQDRIKEHPDFDRWFVEYPEDTTWMEANLFDGDASEHRIPFDVLDSTEAETVYKNLLNKLHAEQKRSELQKDFKKLLEETGYITPGKKLDEVRVLFMGRDCFESLSEDQRQLIYDRHQQELIQRCRKSFQELLLEKADIFYQFRSSPAGTVTHDDILDITEALAEDGRYKALDRMDADRKLLLFQHLGFVHCPIREHCPAFPDCTDSLVERIISRRASRPVSWGTDLTNLNLILLGVEELSLDISDQILSICPHSQFNYGGQIFDLELRRISGDVSLQQNAFKTKKFNPQGCFCVYSDSPSLEYIRASLQKELLSNLEQQDPLPFQGLSMLILFEADPNIPQQELNLLQIEGQNLADSLHCPFLEFCPGEMETISDCLRTLVESSRQKSGVLNVSPPSDTLPKPEIRVIMCLLCGDPFNLEIEKVLGPLLGSKTCTQTGVRCVVVELEIQGTRRTVEVILTSYHSATDFRDDLVHGFILVYSTLRKASLATLSAFSMNIPELPIQVVAVSESNLVDNKDINQALNIQGSVLAGQLNAHFARANLNQSQKGLYQPFFQEVLEKKGEIEKAFSMDERLSGRLDDSGEGTLERPPRRNPIPPPRVDSYNVKGPGSLNSRSGSGRSGSGRSGSGSEIYERLPDSGSHGDLVSGSEDSDIYSQMDSLDRQGGGGGHKHRSSKQNGKHGAGGKPHKSRRQHGSAPPECSPPPIPSLAGRPSFTSSSPSPQLGRERPNPFSRPMKSSTFNASLPGVHGIFKADSMPLEMVKGKGMEHNNFFQAGSDEYLDMGGSCSPPEPAPPDRTMNQSRGGRPEQLQYRRLVKASTMPGGSHTSLEDISCWADDSQLPNKRPDSADAWQTGFGGGAYTTGRRGRSRAPLPALPPGKINLSDYNHVSAALGRLQVKPRSAPLAAVEDLDRDHEGGYAVPRDTVTPGTKSEYSHPVLEPARSKPRSKNRERRERQAKLEISDSESELSSDERHAKKPTAGKRPRKKRSAPVPIPVAPPAAPRTGIPVAMPQVPVMKPVPTPRVPEPRNPAPILAEQRRIEPELKQDTGTFSETESSTSPPSRILHARPFMFPPPPSGPPPPDQMRSRVDEGLLNSPREEQTDKQKRKLEKEEKVRLKEIARQEKKEKEREKKEEREKAKEEKKKEKAEKKVAARQGMKANSVQGAVCMDDFRASEDDPIPVFLSRTIKFIELEGLDAEGLYRVPGNRAHVDLLFQQFDEDKNIDLGSLDIAVNAVATAVKDFFFKRLPPLLPTEHMTDLESIASMQDRHMKLLELKKLLDRLPRSNYAVIKFIFQHFVRVTERSKDNCMDSKNLAICWWPTLLQYEFGDLTKFETMRPHLEDVVQTLIDQFRFLFCGQEEVMMV
ncbi:rho GTPase-activating protein 190 isoform X4 [Eurytemora carolleeae]|uniref:rho GTPase-activating protein 190 isoform X4 n=1 Tax=Eurytemora carolleeae TaxID=1294199 RepID=UPI000C76C5DF|nr:rho GTPase-activating protein 190 isoform X4 [Eurytemora carolleeae]|eukprot:XP_023343055.1 rho GTPase-activating protein 190-like isoform X4 [Eurytemora affinis]